jgi:O-antigen/teichoic acid export membrane protein
MVRQIIFTFGIRFCSAVLNFLVIVLLSQGLGPEGKGICTKYIAIISNALIFCDLLGGPAIVYLAARNRVKSMILPAYTWSALTSGIVISVFFLLGQIDLSEMLHLVVLSFINSCIAIHQNILSGRMKFGKVNLLVFLQALLTFAFLKLQFSTAGAVPANYIYSLYFAWGLTALLGIFFVLSLQDTAQKIPVFTFLRSAFNAGVINQLGHILQFFNQRLSYFLLGENPLGIFSNAVSVGESAWMIPNSIAGVQYGKVSNTEDKVFAGKISLVLLKLNLVLVLFAVTILVLLPDNFFTWVFGKEFAGMPPLLLLLFPGLVFYSGFLVLGHHFSGRGQFSKNLWPICTGLVFTAGALLYCYFSFQEFTMKQAAAVTSLSYFGNFITAVYLFSKDAEIRFKDFIPSGKDIKFILGELKRKKES